MIFQDTSGPHAADDLTDPGWLAPGADTAAMVLDGTMPAGLNEAFVQGKSPLLQCEDVLVITERHIAVVDGMSSPLATRGQAPTGRVFAQAAALAIRDLSADTTAGTAVQEITAGLRGISAGHEGPAGAVAAIYSVQRREVWRVGDVHIAIGDSAYPATKEVDVALEYYRAAVNAALLAAGTSLQEVLAADPGLDSARQLLSVQPALANKVGAFGYGVLNGSPVPTDFIEVLPVPPGTSQLVLASDGYLSAGASFEVTENKLLDAMADDPAGIGLLRQMAKCTKTGNNAPDDRSYLRLVFGAGTFTPPTERNNNDASHSNLEHSQQAPF